MIFGQSHFDTFSKNIFGFFFESSVFVLTHRSENLETQSYESLEVD